jgi:hypothetical protein
MEKLSFQCRVFPFVLTLRAEIPSDTRRSRYVQYVYKCTLPFGCSRVLIEEPARRTQFPIPAERLGLPNESIDTTPVV